MPHFRRRGRQLPSTHVLACGAKNGRWAPGPDEHASLLFLLRWRMLRLLLLLRRIVIPRRGRGRGGEFVVASCLPCDGFELMVFCAW